jgi:hypothetical protein
MTSSHPTPAPCQWFARLASALDRRSAPRLALLFLGAVLARGGGPSPPGSGSHADKRRAWRRALLGEEIRATLRPGVTELEIQAAADRLLSLAA